MLLCRFLQANNIKSICNLSQNWLLLNLNAEISYCATFVNILVRTLLETLLSNFNLQNNSLGSLINLRKDTGEGMFKG